MIAQFQFGTRLLRPALRDSLVDEVAIEQLDVAEDIPLRSVCWLERERPETFEAALADDHTVEEARQLVSTDHGCQYQITYSRPYPGTDVYDEAIDTDGVFVRGRAGGKRWTLQFRFPDREAFSAFRDSCEQQGLDVAVQSVQDQETAPHAEQYGISEPQREILLLAIQRGYFEVPRDASLADLADELGVSSQAASERLRRGLDSLVDSALLVPE